MPNWKFDQIVSVIDKLSFTHDGAQDHLFRKICTVFSTPEIDLFASRINAKCARYVSRNPDPGAYHVDAFTMSWQGLNVYIFPPCSLLFAVLRKLKRDRPISALVVAPSWPAAPWWTRLQGSAKNTFNIGRKRHNVQVDEGMQQRYPRGIPLTIFRF